ncbi:hypothetical protein F4808DRAFT_266972 [Astrocystis sublimbata]|nr:hypothetical protein F4808DRAFT_266972 [Astrocystis sublimbata]
MASTPETSFSSDHSGGGQQKHRQRSDPAPLKQPQRSESVLPSPEQTESSESPASIPSDVDEDIIQHAFDVVWAFYCSLPLPTGPYPTFHFTSPPSFDALYRRFDEHKGLSQFVLDNFRVDWNADTCELLLRLMPTFVHDIFQNLVQSAIKAELKRVSEEYPELEPTYRNIIPAGHAFSQRGSLTSIKSPDGQFLFQGAPTSPLLFEVAYSEDERKALNKLHEYFTHTPGYTILTFDLDYAPPKKRRAEGHTHCAAVLLATSIQDVDDPEYIAVDELLDSMFREDGQPSRGTSTYPSSSSYP